MQSRRRAVFPGQGICGRLEVVSIKSLRYVKINRRTLQPLCHNRVTELTALKCCQYPAGNPPPLALW